MPRVLVFSKTGGFRHSSIPDGIAAIQKLGSENGFIADTTENAQFFNDDSLKNYSAVIFLNTTEEVLNHNQQIAFERYIQAGGGFVGIHSATDTEYDWGWYGRLVGGYFNGHPVPQKAKFIIKDKNHPSTDFFTDTVWQRTDELYNFKKLNTDVHVLITIDESSYEGGTNGAFHPMAWYHEYDGGRAFYTELGHTEASYTEENYLKHILGGIEYAIGKNFELDYEKATSTYPPDEDRFTKTVLIQGEFFEPTEMTILPNLDIMVIQRRGEILLYKNETKKLKQIGYLNVYWQTLATGANVEEGLLGLCKDPNFAKNNWVYMYYSPADTSVNRLSRFEFKNDTIDLKSEKIILQLYSQREICCHTGGSIAFGPDGLLYVSTGDNSTPFDEEGEAYVNHGFAPLNDATGHFQYDARRSSGNTNDLRGKILRIRVKDDGTYEIPEGNLFPKNDPKAKPEIYVMGDRNPYRISVDQKNSFLYWGEVGPDAGDDSIGTRGPRGYDEINQARKAGFFGWPFFVGNNYPYHEYDYTTGVSGKSFDAAKPVNNSKNNTGLTELPAAQPAFIWYPYANSHDFPEVGSGGRNAMAGPVYYTDMFPKETRYPEYYNGKLFIYDWIRGWIKCVTMLPNGDFDKMEPFMENTKLSNMIDMEVGPDGKLYQLEYGTGWFAKNPDAGLSRIDFNGGNRAPKITSFSIDKKTGALPFKIKASVVAEDPEKAAITYKWDLGNGTKKETTTPSLEFTYTTAGDYKVTVQAIDAAGDSVTAKPVEVYAGNETPQINILITGNKTFYFPGKPLTYRIAINDKGDTSKTIDPASLFVSVDYIQGYDMASVPQGHQQNVAMVSGKNIMLSLDCKSCHKEAEKSIGPSFLQISEKYAKDPNALTYLSQKIIKGGGGVWGDVQMAAHPNLSQSDVGQIVQWVLSLGRKAILQKSLPQSGSIVTASKPGNTLILSASYTDKGGNNIKALTGSNSIALGSNTYLFSGNEKTKGFGNYNFNNTNYLVLPNEGWFMLEGLDLTGLSNATIMAGWQLPPAFGYDFELRLDNPEGKIIGRGSLMPPFSKNQMQAAIPIKIESIADGNLHNLYFVSKAKDAKEIAQAGLGAVVFN